MAGDGAESSATSSAAASPSPPLVDSQPSASQAEDRYGSLLCLLRCLNAEVDSMSADQTTLERQLSTPSTKQLPLIRASLFSNVPASICFYRRDKKATAVLVKKAPKSHSACFQWCQSTLLSHVTRRTLLCSHFELVPETSTDWRGYWGKHLHSKDYPTLRRQQKVNHFPGNFHLGRKDRLWQHLKENAFDIMPYTYVLPRDTPALQAHLDAGDKERYVILKPPASARGRGISIVSRFEDVPTNEPLVAQHYVDPPLTIDGAKFDLRLYVGVTSLEPLRVYLYRDGLVRLASVRYTPPHKLHNNPFSHLTNFSLNKTEATDSSTLKWRLDRFWQIVEAAGQNPNELWTRIQDVAVKAVVACVGHVRRQQASYTDFSHLSRELFGMDVLIDSNWRPWLLELNISPSMQTPTNEDTAVKAPLIATWLNMWRMEFLPNDDVAAADVSLRCKPLAIHKSEQHVDKEIEHVAFYAQTHKIKPEILSHLTDADTRYLIDYTDEYALRGDFELIYPVKETIEQYLPLLDLTYADLLLASWVSLPHREQKIAVERLKDLAKDAHHLSATPYVAKSSN